MTLRFVLLDIEGTITDIQFVHQVLFPYSAERLAPFVEAHLKDARVKGILQRVKETVQEEDGEAISSDEAIDHLLCWIADDRKHGALKDLQGMIWKTGFEQGDYQGHIYPDVIPALDAWKAQGIGLGIYSSGSVEAQKLLLGYSVLGDLTSYFSRYFDTQVGGKKESASYQKIAEALQLVPEQILFLSDVVEELQAAQEAGFQVTQLVRTPDVQTGSYPTVADFSALKALSAPASL